jgi:hypothetical protein
MRTDTPSRSAARSRGARQADGSSALAPGGRRLDQRDDRLGAENVVLARGPAHALDRTTAQCEAAAHAAERPVGRRPRQRQRCCPCRPDADAAALERADGELEPRPIDHRDQAATAVEHRTRDDRARARILQQRILDQVGQRLSKSRARQRRHRRRQQRHVARVEHQPHCGRTGQALERHALDPSLGPAATHREQLRLAAEGALALAARWQPDDRLAAPQRRSCHITSMRSAMRSSRVSLFDSTRS